MSQIDVLATPSLSAVAAYRETAVSQNHELNRIADTLKRDASRKSDKVVCIHLYYPDMIDDFSSCVRALRTIELFDVIITIPRSWSRGQALAVIDNIRPVRLLVCENRGRDILPFIRALNAAHQLGYVYGCKLHSKKSLHVKWGKEWGLDLISSLTNDAFVREALNILETDKSVGLVAPLGTLLSAKDPDSMRDNYYHIERVVRTMNISSIPLQDFVAGTMFWFRLSAVELIRKLPFSEQEFGPELGSIDGTLAHAIERLIPTFAKASGFETRLCVATGSPVTSYLAGNLE